MTRPPADPQAREVQAGDDDVYAVRDQLPVVLGWEYEHDGRTDMVRVGLGSHWPEIMVGIRPNRGAIEVRGTFSTTDRLRELEFSAVTDSAEVTAADLRWSGAVRALREWASVGRELTDQIRAGKSPDQTVFDAHTPTEALRILSQSAVRRRPSAIRRGPAFEQLLREVADAYRAAIDAGDPKPRVTLAARFGYSNAHIGWLLTQARKSRNGRSPLLGPAQPGKAGEQPEGGAQ